MRSGQKRGRSEGLDLSVFCQSYATILAEADLAESKLYLHLTQINVSNMAQDDLITSLRKTENVTKFDVYLLMVGLACSGEIKADIVSALFASSKLKRRKDVKHLLAAAKVDLVNAIKADADPEQFTSNLLKMMLSNQPFDAVKAVFESTDSCYLDMLTGEHSTFNAVDHMHIYRGLLGDIAWEHRGAPDLLDTAERQKDNEEDAARQRVVNVLRDLGCDDALIANFSEQLLRNQMQIPVLIGEYNARLIRGVTDMEAKRHFMQQLLDEFNQQLQGSNRSTLTKRQRLYLLPVENQQVIFPMLEQELSPIEYLCFTIENVNDVNLVVGTVETNKAYFIKGEHVYDCCVAVLPEFRMLVLQTLLDDVLEESYITAALDGLNVELIKAYLAHITPLWVKEGYISYVELINNTDAYSELEKAILSNLENVGSDIRLLMLGDLYAEFDADYLIYALSLLSKETIDEFLVKVESLFEGASRSSLKSLFRMVWQHHTRKLSATDEAMVNTLSYLHTIDAWVDDDNAIKINEYMKALNRFLSVLPESLCVSIISGMNRVIDVDHCVEFLKSLKRRKEFLKARYKSVCSNFTLTEFIELCNRIVKPVRIIEAYNGSFEYRDIVTFRDLIAKKRVTIKAVKECVVRRYETHCAAVPVFSFTYQMNIYLILLSKYASSEFKKIVKKEFKKLVALHGSFLEAVMKFPKETRASVLRYAPQMCPLVEIGSLFAHRHIPATYQSDVKACVKKLLKKASKNKRKKNQYLSYLRAVFESNQACFLEYCEELQTLNGISITTFMSFGRTEQEKFSILCSLGAFLTVENFMSLMTEGLVDITVMSVNKLLLHVANQALKKLLLSERCDLYLSKVLYPDPAGKPVVLDKNKVSPRNAYQVGVFIGLLPVDDQCVMIQHYRNHIRGKVECAFVLSRCHVQNKAEVAAILAPLQELIREDETIVPLTEIRTLQALEDVVVNMMPTMVFGVVSQWVNLHGLQVIEDDSVNHFSALESIILMLPIQYQLSFALLCLPVMHNENDAQVIAAFLEEINDRSELIKAWRLTQGAAKSPVKALGNSQFGLFKPSVNSQTDAESPSKKARRFIQNMSDDE